jgi:lipopolysaccharide export system permease protein
MTKRSDKKDICGRVLTFYVAMPRLLYSYLTTQVLAPFYGSLIILTSILFLGRIIPILEIIFDYGIEVIDFIRLFTYFTPLLLIFALPMSSMMGVIIGATRLTNDNETMVLKSSGISLYKMLPPIIAIGLLTSLLTGFFSIHLMPVGNQAKAKLLFQLAKEKVDRSLQEKRFSETLGDMVLYTDKQNPRTRNWEGIYIADLRDQSNPVVIIAKTGSFATDIKKESFALVLNDGSLHRNPENINQTIGFKKYVLDLPIETPQENPLAKRGKPNMTQVQLLKEAERLGRDTKAGAVLLTEFHKRLALPVSCFILTLLGFPLGLLAGPRQKAIGIPLGLFIFILFYAFLTAGKSLSESQALPAGIAMWAPNAIFFVFTLLMIHSMAGETYTTHLEKFYDFMHRVANTLPWRKRREM